MSTARPRRPERAISPALRLAGPPVAILALVATLAGCSDEVGSRPARNADLSVSFVGRDACLPCHASVGKTFAQTGMGRSFYPLTPETAVEDFSGENRFAVPEANVTYEMFTGDGGYWMRQSVLAPDGSVMASVDRPMLYVVGSGNHARSYLTGGNGVLYQMPVCWYPDKPGWDHCPGYEVSSKYLTRRVDDSCLFCHNARMPTVPGSERRYAENLPHGIDCERCHGPGELHVALWRNAPQNPPDRDDTIVNPRRLPRETRMQVCLQCHLGDADASERVQRPGRDLGDFRPGGHVADFMDVLTFDPPEPGRFGLGAQGDRLLLSRCYKESDGGMDCLTCHNPHVSIYDPGRPPDHFRKACLGCHDVQACGVPERERRATVETDDCVACHMRRSEPADQRFTAFTDHWIRRGIEPPGPPASGRRSLTLVPLYRDRAKDQAAGEAALTTGVAYLGKKLEGEFKSAIPWSQPESWFRSAVESDPSMAEGWYFLGRTALRQGRISEAIGDFREALKLDPGHRKARLSLATTLQAQGRPEEAAPLLAQVIAEHPEDVGAMSELARAQVLLGEEEAAAALLRRAREIEPDEPTVLANAGMLEARRGRHGEAIALLRRAGAIDPSVPEVWEGLAGSLLAVGRADEAIGPARRAVSLRPTLPTAHYYLGRALVETGHRREAASSFLAAVRLNPAYREAASALKELEQAHGRGAAGPGRSAG